MPSPLLIDARRFLSATVSKLNPSPTGGRKFAC
jgi:hypothetical protein